MLDRMFQKILSYVTWTGFPIAAIAGVTEKSDQPYYQAEWVFGVTGTEMLWTVGAITAVFKLYELIESRSKSSGKPKKRFKIKRNKR